MTDDTLAERARSGCGLALTELYRRHSPTLFRFLVRLCPDRDEAEDALQDTFVRVFEGRGHYRGQGRFRSWLFTVASRIVSDRRRQSSRRGELLEQHRETLLPDGPDASAGDSEWDAAGVVAVTEHVLADLPEAYATTFILRVREAFSYREITDILGEPEGTLRSRVHHTLKRIRSRLADVDAAHAEDAQPSKRSRHA